MLLYFSLLSLIKCLIYEEIEDMFRSFEDSDAPITKNSVLHSYFSSNGITFNFDKGTKELKISCKLKDRSIPEDLCKLKKIEKLFLSENLLTRLPNSLCALVNLLHLDLSRNLFREIPTVIFKLESLKHLDLRLNYINQIPDEIVKVVNLETFILSNNLLDSISQEFKKCVSIKVLNLSKNKTLSKFTKDNTQVGQEINLFSRLPPSLTNLNMSHAGLQCISETFDCPNLLSLNLSNNSLKNLDWAFRKLIRLQMLNLNNNNIARFPKQLYELPELNKLTMEKNIITELIFTGLSCRNLVTLSLDNNPLETLTMYNTSLKALHNFNLDGTRLKSFIVKDRNVLNQHHKLRTGKSLISMNIKLLMIGLESLDYIGDVIDLQELTRLSIICRIQKTYIPQDISLQRFSNLENLKMLVMENCGLKIFPKSLLNLQNLTTLSLSKNFITQLPNFIKDVNVKNILLENNFIGDITKELFQNPYIKHVSFRNNLIGNLPKTLSKHPNFTATVNISNNEIIPFGNKRFDGIFDIPYTIAEHIIVDINQPDTHELAVKINCLSSKSRYVWVKDIFFDLKTQEIKKHTLQWRDIYSMFNMLKDKISDTDLHKSTLAYLKKVYQIEEVPRDISVMYGESQRNILKDYIEENIKLLVAFLEGENHFIIENCFILLQNAHNVCFDGQLEHLIEIHKSLTGKGLKCLKTTICNILVRYKYEGLKLITTSNSYKENVHLLSFWRNSLSEFFGFEKIPNLYRVNNTNGLLNSEAYIIFQMFKHLDVNKIVEELKNEINDNSNLMTESTGFLFEHFEQNLKKLEIMFAYDGDLEDLLITGITTEGVVAILLEYNLIEERKKVNRISDSF